jgi:hypothetical protein
MSSYQLKVDCVFVEAHDHDDRNIKKPDKYKFPQVFNQKTGDFVPFDDTGGFIARFIVQGVDPVDIPKILVSEYGSSEANNFATDVNNVLAELKPFIKDRQPRKYDKHVKKTPGTGHDPTFDLDFKVNPIGIVVLKLPIS